MTATPPIQASRALPVVAENMAIGMAMQSGRDIQDAAKAEINRQLGIARRRAQEAASPEKKLELLQRVPLEYDEYLEAVRNYNSWSIRVADEPEMRLPNDSQQLRAFLSQKLARGRHTQTVEGWRNYLADRFGMHFPEPAATPITLPEWARRTHSLVAGSTGTGKSELLKALAYHYVKHDGAAVVMLDPHGDLVRQVAHLSEFQAAAAPRLVYVAYEPELQSCPVLNPFDVKGLPDYALDEYAVDFAKVLGDTIEQGFTPGMANLIRACCRVLFDHRPNGQPSTLWDLHRFVSPKPDDDAADLLAAARSHPDRLIANYFQTDFFARVAMPSKEGLRARLTSLLQYNAFRRMTCSPSTIDLTAAADRGAVILFDLSTMGRVGGDTFGKLIIAQMVAHALRRPEGAESTHTPIHLFVDEAQRLFTGTFLELLEQTRKKGLYLTFAQQVAGRGFSGQDLESLMINTNIKLQGPGGCPPRMLDALNISQADYRQHFPEVEINQQLAGGDFLCKWGARARTIFFRVTRDVAGNRVSTAQFARLLEQQHVKHYQRFDAGNAGAGIEPADDPDAGEDNEWTLR